VTIGGNVRGHRVHVVAKKHVLFFMSEPNATKARGKIIHKTISLTAQKEVAAMQDQEGCYMRLFMRDAMLSFIPLLGFSRGKIFPTAFTKL
jgi:hypothetical protein